MYPSTRRARSCSSSYAWDDVRGQAGERREGEKVFNCLLAGREQSGADQKEFWRPLAVCVREVSHGPVRDIDGRHRGSLSWRFASSQNTKRETRGVPKAMHEITQIV
jgi:hypothetical protein